MKTFIIEGCLDPRWSGHPPTLTYTGDARNNITVTVREFDPRAAVEEQSGREAVVTDAEKAADQMVKDIMGGKIDRTGRQQVRQAVDKMDAPPTGRAAQDSAIGRISRKW